MKALLALPPDAARRVFDRAHCTLVWLAVLALVLPEPSARGLVIAAMVAVALAAVVVAFLATARTRPPTHPEESDHGL